jgi:DNA-binding transcriptional LysR family regulator
MSCLKAFIIPAESCIFKWNGYITPALAQLHNGLNNSLAFGPSTSDIELTFSATDYTQFSLLPKLISHISKIAPNIKITVTPSEDKVQTAKLVS